MHGGIDNGRDTLSGERAFDRSRTRTDPTLDCATIALPGRGTGYVPCARLCFRHSLLRPVAWYLGALVRGAFHCRVGRCDEDSRSAPGMAKRLAAGPPRLLC